MPKVNVYLPDDLAAAVREAQVPVSAVCQAALERAVRDVSALRGTEVPPDETARGPFRRFTVRARTSVENAVAEAAARGHKKVGTEHLLLGVLDEGANLAVAVLTAIDVDPRDVRAELVASMAASGTPIDARPKLSPLAKQALEESTKEALALVHNYIGCEHLLLGLLAVDEGLASQVLRRMGLELRTTRRAVTTALTGVVHAKTQLTPPAPAADSATLDKILARLDAIERRLTG